MATRISLSDHLFSKGFGVGGPKEMIQRFVVMANDVYPAQKKNRKVPSVSCSWVFGFEEGSIGYPWLCKCSRILTGGGNRVERVGNRRASIRPPVGGCPGRMARLSGNRGFQLWSLPGASIDLDLPRVLQLPWRMPGGRGR